MATYLLFIRNQKDHALQTRAKLRWKFFEEEGYRKLSDVFGLPNAGKYNYINNRDEFMLACYIQNVNPDHCSVNDIKKMVKKLGYYVSELLKQDITTTNINIEAVYNYLDERRKCNDWLSSEEKFCTEALSQFENQLRNR